ncbi:MAG: hypothetical protein Q7K26_02330 [bacterium]|nr:hypothetical protein [bacterium]
MILISLLVLPYWIYIPVLFIGIILFPYFWEGILAVFLIDIIHSNATEMFSLLISPLILSVLITLIIMVPVRESLRSYV